MHISEVEAFLSLSRLPSPQHVFIVKETVWQEVDGQVIYRGLQPKERRDVIVLMPQAIDETIPHEIGHCLGLKEFGATVLGKFSAWRYQVLRRYPSVQGFLEKSIRYEKCFGCRDFAKAHQYGTVEHFRLKR